MNKITIELCDDDLAAYEFHAAFQGCVTVENYIKRTIIWNQWQWHHDNGTAPFTAPRRQQGRRRVNLKDTQDR